MNRHDGVKNIVHPSQMFDVREESQGERGSHGDHSSDQHPLPSLPLEVEKSLHGKLARVGASHGRRLARSQDPDRPDVGAGRAERAAKEHPALVQVCFDHVMLPIRKNIVGYKAFF